MPQTRALNCFCIYCFNEPNIRGLSDLKKLKYFNKCQLYCTGIVFVTGPDVTGTGPLLGTLHDSTLLF